MIAIFVTLSIGFFVVCIICMVWQINLAINHPEKYQRLKEWQEDVREKQKKDFSAIAGAGAKAVEVIAKAVSK